jgi:hypothetical protein
MMHKLGIQDPQLALGKPVILNGGMYVNIMGVVKDFQTESKHKKRRSDVLTYSSHNFDVISVRIKPAAMHQTVEKIDKIWSALFPENVFEFEFIDQRIARWYKQEAKVYTALNCSHRLQS